MDARKRKTLQAPPQDHEVFAEATIPTAFNLERLGEARPPQTTINL